MSSTLSLALPAAVEADCRRRIGAGSKSFALASRLLPRPSRRGALVVYAWCRRADDAIDRAPAARQAAALAGLEAELEALFMQAGTGDATIDAFGTVARATAMPPHYPRELLAGMRMDLERRRYADTRALLHYCYRVAGTVGLMMTHVMGLREPGALHAAAHLGIAMQLTNICRDVVEDWRMGRLYLPDELLAPELLAHLPALLGGPLPAAVRAPLRRVVARVLDLAALFYAAAEVGFPALPWRSALSIRAARGIYAAIGDRIRATGCDVLAGRAVVPLAGKLLAVARAGAAAAAELPARARATAAPTGYSRSPTWRCRCHDRHDRPRTRRARGVRPRRALLRPAGVAQSRLPASPGTERGTPGAGARRAHPGSVLRHRPFHRGPARRLSARDAGRAGRGRRDAGRRTRPARAARRRAGPR